MVESTVNPLDNSISVKNSDGTDTGVYIRLDTVKTNGECRIEVFSNITTVTRTNEFGDSTTLMYLFNYNTIPWNLPGYYTKNGVKIDIGTWTTTTDGNGNVTTIRTVTNEEAIEYITENAVEIAGFGIQTRIKVI